MTPTPTTEGGAVAERIVPLSVIAFEDSTGLLADDIRLAFGFRPSFVWTFRDGSLAYRVRRIAVAMGVSEYFNCSCPAYVSAGTCPHDNYVEERLSSCYECATLMYEVEWDSRCEECANQYGTCDDCGDETHADNLSYNETNDCYYCEGCSLEHRRTRAPQASREGLRGFAVTLQTEGRLTRWKL